MAKKNIDFDELTSAILHPEHGVLKFFDFWRNHAADVLPDLRPSDYHEDYYEIAGAMFDEGRTLAQQTRAFQKFTKLLYAAFWAGSVIAEITTRDNIAFARLHRETHSTLFDFFVRKYAVIEFERRPKKQRTANSIAIAIENSVRADLSRIFSSGALARDKYSPPKKDAIRKRVSVAIAEWTAGQSSN